MKIKCSSCGVHFPTEFEDTCKEGCTFWETLGFPDTFPLEDRRIVWDWFFSLNRDDIGLRTGISVDILMRASKATTTGAANDFVEMVPGYKDWADEKRIRYQKELAKYAQKVTDVERTKWLLLSFVQEHPEWENNT